MEVWVSVFTEWGKDEPVHVRATRGMPDYLESVNDLRRKWSIIPAINDGDAANWMDSRMLDVWIDKVKIAPERYEILDTGEEEA